MKKPILSKYDAPAKWCPACFRIWRNAQRVCLECGYEFYKPKTKPK